MKISTWNINGLRATKSPLKLVLEKLDGDIICFQETKVTKDQLESSFAIVDGYNSYFSFSTTRQGYSGVATFCKDEVTPVKAQEGLFDTFEKYSGEGFIGCYGNLKSMFSEERALELDKEGRTIVTQFEILNNELLTVFNVYCPRADPEKNDRIEFKMDFYRALEERAKAVLKSGSHVIICGDINTSHRPIDHCDPNDPEVFSDSPFRGWVNKLLYNQGDYSALKSSIHNVTKQLNVCSDDKDYEETKQEENDAKLLQCDNEANGCFIDTFRYFFPNRSDAFTCWSTLKGCRQTNYGTRIDYIFANRCFHVKYVKFCDIHPEIEGSDHCPVKAELDIDIKPSLKCPRCCTKYMSEFCGRQQKLSSFFTKISPSKKFSTEFAAHEESHKVQSRSSQKRKATGGRPLSKQSKLTFFAKPSPKPETLDECRTSAGIEKPSSKTKKPTVASQFWKTVLKGPDPPPLCHGHKESSLLRTVKKEGPNLGRQFYVCCRPEGHKNNPEARCSFFQWKEKQKK